MCLPSAVMVQYSFFRDICRAAKPGNVQTILIHMLWKQQKLFNIPIICQTKPDIIII